MIGQYLSNTNESATVLIFQKNFGTKQSAGASADAGGVGQRERERERRLLVGLGVPRHDPRRGAQTRHRSWRGTRQRARSARRHVTSAPRRHAWRGSVYLPRHVWGWAKRSRFVNTFQTGSNLYFVSNLG